MKTRFMFLLLVIPLGAFSAPGATRYVDVNSQHPEYPYDRFSRAATVIQDAVDAAAVDDLILVTNGVYSAGGRTVGTSLLANRVAVDKPLRLQSFNGPEVTIIQGHLAPWTTNMDDAIRCVYLANGAVLSGFTLTNGGSEFGGGIYCESVNATITNCILTGNLAYKSWAGGWPSSSGGGVYGGTLNHCTLEGNGAGVTGGGAYLATLNNCTVTGNWSGQWGGGIFGGTLNNCIVAGNSTKNVGYGEGGGAYSATLNNCVVISNTAHSIVGDRMGTAGGASGCILNNCTVVGNSADIIGGGVGGTLNNCIVYHNLGMWGGWSGGAFNYCYTSDPQFVNLAAGDLRLQSNSPCINAGLNAAALGPVDLDGNPRIRGGVVDIGAYESLAVPLAQPRFVGLYPGESEMTLHIWGDPGVMEIYASSNLTSWFLLDTATNYWPPLYYVDKAATNQPRRFYNAIQLL